MTEQVIVERAKSELVAFDEVAAIIAEYKVENENLAFDYADKEGAKQAKSHIRKLRGLRPKIAAIHKGLKADALAYGRSIDAVKNKYDKEVLEMVNYHQDPLDAIEKEKAAIALAKAEALEAEKAAVEAKKQEELAAREAEIYLKEQEVREAEEKLRKEQEKLMREQREKEIAENAAKEAKLQAEREAKAKAQAKELAEKKAKEAGEAKEKKRIENVKHRQEVEDKILKSLLFLGPALSFKMLNALKDNKIPNVTINY